MPRVEAPAQDPDVSAQQRPDVSGPAPAGPPLLITMDGTSLSIPALRAGAAIARHCGYAPRILTIIEPSIIAPMPQAPAMLVHAWPLAADRANRLRTITAQVRETLDESREWPIAAEVGNPSEAIAWTAMHDGAELITMGLRAHRRWDRLTGRETVLQVVRQVDTAVLAVTPELETLPRRVLVAMDFSRSSVRAARVALRLLEPGAILTLAYVRPASDFSSEVAEGAGVILQQGIAASFARLRRILDAPPGVEIRPTVLDGRPADALLRAAFEQGADLIAAGRHRRDFFDQLTIGSVATQLIRAAQCSLLITPPGPAIAER